MKRNRYINEFTIVLIVASRCTVTTERGFLARYVSSEEETLSVESARDGWLGMEPSLQAEWKRWRDITSESGDEFFAASAMGLELIAAKSNNLQEVETRASMRNLDGDLEPPRMDGMGWSQLIGRAIAILT